MTLDAQGILELDSLDYTNIQKSMIEKPMSLRQAFILETRKHNMDWHTIVGTKVTNVADTPMDLHGQIAYMLEQSLWQI